MGAELSAGETEFIDFFVALARALRAPKSLGEIYGLLFASSEPRTFEGIVATLRISRGSASQGLRLLRTFGAVRVVYVAGDRRDHFVAETELRKLVTGFLSETALPQLEASAGRLDRIAERVPTKGVLHDRLQKLRSWERVGRQVLPLVGKLLG
ncbi:MAG: hypothetical protein JSR82_15925 [Verrucomicrobia bacterium]|nr:hypothetical protein [Verrucomicrobiota bacterium]